MFGLRRRSRIALLTGHLHETTAAGHILKPPRYVEALNDLRHGGKRRGYNNRPLDSGDQLAYESARGTMEAAKIYFVIFGLLTIAGGIVGYVKAGSVASVIAGAITGFCCS